ncbi:MAG: tRNA1(Val) (adenine(37)-N6)-methyltransferase [Bacteroidia bacterium]|nr:MAG: tRNA1(Val) (adenine(37)-N6)-methyltransferase [Bacteroidia bacterium]
MPKDYSAFKQFTIYQPFDDVMKVSTDSVLLGCFADVEKLENGKALDIGCGTGLLSLMLAQKNPSLEFILIDINPNACKNAEYNIYNSPFKNSFSVILTSLKNFLEKTKDTFDVIICNPPYFSNSLKSSSFTKNLYRHQEELSYEDLIYGVKKLLKEQGSFYVCIPFNEYNAFIEKCREQNMFIHRMMMVFSSSTKSQPYLFLLDIRKEKVNEEEVTSLTIQDKNGQFTEDYLNFTHSFYIFAK